MKKLNRLVPDVPQGTGDRGTEVIERVLAAYGVSRASDLPEEGKMRLVRELRLFFEAEFPEGLTLLRPSDVGLRGWLKGVVRRLVGLRQPPGQ
jgi:hypothetical protein